MRITKRSFSTVVFPPRYSLRKRGSALGLSKTFAFRCRFLGIACTSAALLSAYRKRLKKFRRQKYDLSSKHPNFGDRFTARYIRLQTPSLSDRMPGTTGKSQKSEKLRIATESPPHAADHCPSCAFGFRIGRKSLSPHAKQSIQPTDEQPVAAFDSADFILYL